MQEKIKLRKDPLYQENKSSYSYLFVLEIHMAVNISAMKKHFPMCITYYVGQIYLLWRFRKSKRYGMKYGVLWRMVPHDIMIHISFSR